MKNKHLAREFAFQFFFHLELPIYNQLKTALSDGAETELTNELMLYRESTTQEITGDNWIFTKNLVSKALENHKRIEELLEQYSKKWKVERMAKVDKTLLTLGITELLKFQDTPTAVVINEYIELAKKYGSEESHSFINGILDNLAKNER